MILGTKAASQLPAVEESKQEVEATSDDVKDIEKDWV